MAEAQNAGLEGDKPRAEGCLESEQGSTNDKADTISITRDTNSQPVVEDVNPSLITEGNPVSNLDLNPKTDHSCNQQSSATSDLERELHKLKRDLESMVLKYAKSERENLQNKHNLETLDKKLKRAIKDNDQLANRIKLLTHDKAHLTDTLNAKVAQLTVLEHKNSQINNFQDSKLKECEEQVSKMERSNEELLRRIESYKSKEGELLDFCERLSMKHMILQSELDEALKKVPSFKEEYEKVLAERDNLIQRNKELVTQLESLTDELDRERKRSESLRTSMEADETKYRCSLDELQNEIKVMRRKHQIVTRELVKEIKRLEKVESSS